MSRKSENQGIRVGVGIAVVLIVVVTLAGEPRLQDPPQLVMGESVHADLAALAQETWDQFLTVFRVRWDCFGDVRLEAAYGLESRAGYDPDTATVTVRVPGTAAMLQSGLVHEWAHHIEFQCPAHEELRPAFLAAQGLPPNTPWRPADLPAYVPSSVWADIPSEQYAEAVVELVLGGRPIPTGARVSPEAVHVVGEWARSVNWEPDLLSQFPIYHEGRTRFMFERILVPVDGSKHARGAVEMAVELSKHHSSSVFLLHVIRGLSLPPEILEMIRAGEVTESRLEILQDSAEIILDSARKKFEEAGLSGVHSEYVMGDPATKILEYGEQKGVDLIVMGHRGLGPGKGLLGSVARKLLNVTNISVLIAT